MATTPSVAPTKPVFTRVQQSGDFDDLYACLATLGQKSLAEIKTIAVGFGAPEHGPYAVNEELIAKIAMACGLVSTNYKERETQSGIADFPDVALLWLDVDLSAGIGRHVIFLRDRTAPKPLEYVIDVAGWIPESLHLRNDWKNISPTCSYYIGIHKAGPKTGK